MVVTIFMGKFSSEEIESQYNLIKLLLDEPEKYRDAINATKTAVEEGFVPGGGATLVHISKELLEWSKENLKEDELKKLFLMPKEINWPKLAEGYQVNFKSVSNFKKLREAFDWSISIQKSVIIKVDVDPENEICEKNALLEKIFGS